VPEDYSELNEYSKPGLKDLLQKPKKQEATWEAVMQSRGVAPIVGAVSSGADIMVRGGKKILDWLKP
jgi:hypothetical protein